MSEIAETFRDYSVKAQQQWKEPSFCPVIDFLATIDASARLYDPDLICDDMAPTSDIVCRMHFRQVGLEHLANSTCTLTSSQQVPKVVYFVIFGTYIFKFWHYIAIMAAHKNISPSAVYVIGDQHPQGTWWHRVLRDIHVVRFVYRELPENISGIEVRFRHHLSDIVRLQILYMNGGIYLDADMVVVRDLEPLLDYDITLGMVENGTGMGNAFIATKRGSAFLREWYTEYSRYQRDKFYFNSLQVPRNMYFKDPSRVHIESERLYRPNWFEADLLYKRSDYPWRSNFAVHVWTNGNPVPRSPDDIQEANSTIAQIFRQVMYGDSIPRTRKLLGGGG
ncbi:glycosyltransferase family 32 protein [Elysia marginata]|uniref:Glycosyltransferase family 32 protein n=1 Tax=Elysia marginata TaxID=1093978 RepID=A0AAV4I5H9_9GAST|nr:glycosyltransferase family 32 protein [Elysia marginata]